MRGKREEAGGGRAEKGITPAHAGKTAQRMRAIPMRWDHPRACGENFTASEMAFCRLGSPPRMRGKPTLLTDGVQRAGITPAHAGKTMLAPDSFHPSRDHPRACGENKLTVSAFSFASGSPPRMRGKQETAKHWKTRYGITPAHAGKTGVALRADILLGDHPRACGENSVFIPIQGQEMGSPPRMRGKQAREQSFAVSSGITPAHAGKTHPSWSDNTVRRDHPRACGENTSERAYFRG